MRFNHLLLCCAFLFAGTSARAQNLIVVTDTQHPMPHIPDGAQVIQLDAADEINDLYFGNLPSDPVQAEKAARERIQHIDQIYQNTLRAALQGAVDAWTLGVTKIPAVIVDQRYVVYGESNVEQAVLRIKAYQENGQ